MQVIFEAMSDENCMRTDVLCQGLACTVQVKDSFCLVRLSLYTGKLCI